MIFKPMIKRLTVAGAVVLGAVVWHASDALSACAASPCVGEWNTLNVQAVVDDTVTVTENTPLGFGTIGAIKDGTDQAVYVMLADGTGGTPTDDAGDGVFGASPAAIVNDPNGGAPGEGDITVSNAFEGVDIWVDYCIGDQGSCAGIGAVNGEQVAEPGGEYFILQEVRDNLSSAAGAAGCVSAACADAFYNSVTDTRQTGLGHVQVGGTMNYQVGGTLATQTDDGYGPYDNDTYAGTYEVLYSY